MDSSDGAGGSSDAEKVPKKVAKLTPMAELGSCRRDGMEIMGQSMVRMAEIAAGAEGPSKIPQLPAF